MGIQVPLGPTADMALTEQKASEGNQVPLGHLEPPVTTALQDLWRQHGVPEVCRVAKATMACLGNPESQDNPESQGSLDILAGRG